MCLPESRFPVSRVLVLWILLSGPATGAGAQERGFYIETPFVHQAENYCGPAALAMVFRYWGETADQHELAREYHPFPEKGLTGAQLATLSEGKGFTAYTFRGEAGRIREHLRNGRPVIVALRSSELLNRNHFVVVVGWAPGSREWVVQDPAGRAYRRLPAQDFADRWGELGNWSLLVVPAS